MQRVILETVSFVMNILVPLEEDISCGSPGKRVIVFAFLQGDSAGAHHNVQLQGFGIDGDGAKVCVQFVVFHFLATHQLPIDCNPCMKVWICKNFNIKIYVFENDLCFSSFALELQG